MQVAVKPCTWASPLVTEDGTVESLSRVLSVGRVSAGSWAPGRAPGLGGCRSFQLFQGKRDLMFLVPRFVTVQATTRHLTILTIFFSRSGQSWNDV